METRNEFIPLQEIHPGYVLHLELEERQIKQSTLANQLGIAPSNMSGYINGKRNFTADFALKLEDVLAIPAIHWINLQANYDLTLARKRRDSNKLKLGKYAAIL